MSIMDIDLIGTIIIIDITILIGTIIPIDTIALTDTITVGNK
jgi:hypothetical protein